MNNSTLYWFKGALEKWQKEVLSVFLLNEAQNLPFPLDPN